MSFLKKLGHRGRVERDEFDKHLKAEHQERTRLAARLRVLEIESANLARVKRLPGERGR